MKRQLLIAQFLATPWAMMPEHMNAMAGVLGRWQDGIAASNEVMQAVAGDREARDAKRTNNVRAGGGAIAVLPLYGVVTQRGNMADDISGPGSVSTQRFSAALREALADDSVGQILIDIDSPGGSVYGVAELGNEIIAARAQKPIVSIANSLAASAAYWIGCCASEFYVTPGGEVGSIGVWQAHQDVSKMLDEKGVKTTLISAGKYKTEGNMYAPLGEEAQAFMQQRVGEYYQAFTKAVAKGRGVSIDAVRNGMGQGRVLGADGAVAEKMVDGVITFDDLVRKMQRAGKTSQVPQSTGASRLASAERTLQMLG